MDWGIDSSLVHFLFLTLLSISSGVERGSKRTTLSPAHWSLLNFAAFMAQKTCSSSSSSIQRWSWDVFVSFHGKDTRLSFTDQLFAALCRNRIRTFRDDREIERGEAIWTELEKAIVTSRIAVIVFSRNYAASSWCLKELEKIMECRRSLKQIVLPVFYDVDPSDVRNQKGSLEMTFTTHEERFGLDKVRRWRAALTEAANLCGEDLQNVANR